MASYSFLHPSKNFRGPRAFTKPARSDGLSLHDTKSHHLSNENSKKEKLPILPAQTPKDYFRKLHAVHSRELDSSTTNSRFSVQQASVEGNKTQPKHCNQHMLVNQFQAKKRFLDKQKAALAKKTAELERDKLLLEIENLKLLKERMDIVVSGFSDRLDTSTVGSQQSELEAVSEIANNSQSTFKPLEKREQDIKVEVDESDYSFVPCSQTLLTISPPTARKRKTSSIDEIFPPLFKKLRNSESKSMISDSEDSTEENNDQSSCTMSPGPDGSVRRFHHARVEFILECEDQKSRNNDLLVKFEVVSSLEDVEVEVKTESLERQNLASTAQHSATNNCDNLEGDITKPIPENDGSQLAKLRRPAKSRSVFKNINYLALTEHNLRSCDVSQQECSWTPVADWVEGTVRCGGVDAGIVYGSEDEYISDDPLRQPGMVSSIVARG